MICGYPLLGGQCNLDAGHAGDHSEVREPTYWPRWEFESHPLLRDMVFAIDYFSDGSRGWRR